jgi:hypothetical protein
MQWMLIKSRPTVLLRLKSETREEEKSHMARSILAMVGKIPGEWYSPTIASNHETYIKACTDHRPQACFLDRIHEYHI